MTELFESLKKYGIHQITLRNEGKHWRVLFLLPSGSEIGYKMNSPLEIFDIIPRFFHEELE